MLGKQSRDVEESPIPEIPATGSQGQRPRGDAITNALAADMSVVHEHAQWWNPAMKPQVETIQASEVEETDGAISAWIADESSRGIIAG